MSKNKMSGTVNMDHIEMVSIGMMIRRFGKDNITDMLLTEREVDGHKEYFIQSVVNRLATKSEGRGVIKRDAVNEAIDVTMPEFFGSAA